MTDFSTVLTDLNAIKSELVPISDTVAEMEATTDTLEVVELLGDIMSRLQGLQLRVTAVQEAFAVS